MSRQRSSSQTAAVVGAVAGGLLLLGGVGAAIGYAIQEIKKRNEAQKALEELSSVSEAATYFTARSDDVHSNISDDYFSCVSDLSDEPELNKLFDSVDLLMEGTDEDSCEAFTLLRNKLTELSNNANFLWRFAKAHVMQANRKKNRQEKEKSILEGLKYAEEGLKIDESNPEVHKWYASLVGMKEEFVENLEKLECAQLFFKHINLALRLNPKDPFTHYLLGRFKFEVASLSWYQRFPLVTLLSISDITYRDALDCFLKAEHKEKPEKWNKLMLAKCYLKLENPSECKKYLKEAKSIKSRKAEDFCCDEELSELCTKLKIM